MWGCTIGTCGRGKKKRDGTKYICKKRSWFSGPFKKKVRARESAPQPVPFVDARTSPVTRITFSRPPFWFLWDTCVLDRLIYIFIYPAGRIDATDLYYEIYECAIGLAWCFRGMKMPFLWCIRVDHVLDGNAGSQILFYLTYY